MLNEQITVAGVSFRIDALDAPDDAVRALIRGTVWGSPGGLRYRNKTSDWSRLRPAQIMTARATCGELVAVAVFAAVPWGVYIAAVAAVPGRAPVGLAASLCRMGAGRLEPKLGEGQIIAGLVVSDNRAAMLATKRAGLQAKAGVDAILYSRLAPRGSRRCRRLRAPERSAVLAELDALRRGLQDAAQTLLDDEYFVCVEDGRLVAGLQVCAQRLELLSLGSRLDPLLLRLFPWLVGTRAHELSFLQVFHLWGSDNRLGELCSHVLHEFGLRLACIQLDPEDPMWRPVRKGLRPGVAASLAGVESMVIFATGPIPRPVSVTTLMGSFG